MDFLIVAVMFLMLLAASTWGLVEAIFLTMRLYRWVRYSWPSRLSVWRYERQRRALTARYLSGGAKPVSFKDLRFTRKER